MNDNNPRPQDEDDADFEQELTRLYRAALLDEQFQQQVQQDLQSLSVSSQAELKPAEQVFVQEENLSAAAKARMLDMIPLCRQKQSASSKPQPWWRRLLTRNWGSSLLPGPLFSLPATLMAGVLFGVLLPTLLSSLGQPEYVTRGGETGKSIVTRPDAQVGAQTGITDEARQNPQQWLEAIANLLRQGKVAQARAELQAFELQYPNYRP